MNASQRHYHHYSKKVTMYEAIFISRSIQYHRDVNYHAMDDNSNYKAKSIEELVKIMMFDGALVEEPDDSGNSFTITFLQNRMIVGVGMMIEDDVFRVLLNDGSVQDYGATGNLK